MLRSMKLMVMGVIIFLFVFPALAQEPSQKAPIVAHHYPDLEIKVWTDKGEGAVYNPGEEIEVFFQTSEDCYVLIYNIDTRGYVNILYPYEYSDPQWVSGGRIHRVPEKYEDYQLIVDGPEGIEYIHAICSTEPMDLPNWPRYFGGFREGEEEVSVLRLEEEEDPYDFMQFTTECMAGSGDFAQDLCIFTVEYSHPKWYYWPRIYPTEHPSELGACYIHYPNGAEIYIDGVFYGIAPITIPYLIMGRHFVTVYFYGCRIFWDWIWVYPHRTAWVRPHRYYERCRFVYDHPFRKEYRVRKEKSFSINEEKPSRRKVKVLKAESEKYMEKGNRAKIENKKRVKVEKKINYQDSSKRGKDDLRLKSKKTERKIPKEANRYQVKKDKKLKVSSSKKIDKKERKTIKSTDEPKVKSQSKNVKKENTTVTKTTRRKR